MIKNNKGQGLTEYIILVALLAVSSIGIVRILGKSMQSQIANITFAIQGNSKKIQTDKINVDAKLYKKKDLSNFIDGAASDNKE